MQWRTKVVSTASCTPPKSGNASATISNLRASRAMENQSCVHCQLHTTEKWQRVSHYFQSACVACVRHREVHVPHQHVDGDSGSTFSEDSSGSAFHCKPSSTQYPSSGNTTTPMVAKKGQEDGHIDTCAQRGAKGDGDDAEEKHPKQMRVNSSEKIGGGDAENQACKWSTL